MKRLDIRKALAVLTAVLMLTVCLTPGRALTLPYTPSSYYASSQYYTALTSVTLTGNQRADIVAVALSQLGYHEGNSIYDLGGGNQSGYCNFTEYCYWYGLHVMGNSSGYYGAWCAMFIAWCAEMARIPASIITRACYAHAGDSSPYYFNGLTFYNRGSYTPLPGDLIFYDWPDVSGTWNHVGIVHYVEGENVHTIEGNTGEEAVVLRTISMSNSTIIGYGVPAYTGSSEMPSPEPTTPAEDPDPSDPSSYPVPTRTLRQGCTGSDVCWLQAALTRLGYPLDIDGVYGTLTYNAVVSFQRDNGLSVDGICGPITRQAIINGLAALGSSTPEPTASPTPTPIPTPTPAPTAEPTVSPAPAPITGDADGNGFVDANDALAVMRYALGLIDAIDFTAADVDGSGSVDANDALIIMRAVLGLAALA